MAPSRVSDPFDTARLREAVLAAWRTSPTRLREDANAEEDLYLGGYRDRLLVELAQNAADAAQAAGVAGHLRVSLVGDELRVANTGRPLDAAGVASLASLRASAKEHGVGQFGLGFAAVLTVCDEPRVVSRTGGVAFSAARTREELGTTDRVPVLRLVWPTDEDPVPDGFDTEVRLPLKDEPPEFSGQAVDLLLALDGLDRIDIGGRSWRRDGDDLYGPDGVTHWTIVRESGELPPELTGGLPTEHRPQWTICWAYADGQPDQVLHAPTPTDERLSLPARLIATLPVEPSRRRIMPGPATDAVLDAAVRLYPKLLDKVDRPTELVPLPGFPLSEVDDRLRQGITSVLRNTAWLPTPNGDPVSPGKAALLPTDSPALAELLADVVPGLVTAEYAAPEHAAALAALDTTRLHTADIVAAVTGIDRPPSWWYRLYDALSPIAEVDSDAREALGGLPVPMADGRTIPGPRGALIVDGDVDHSFGDAVHPEAAHPLLERLGARRGGTADLLDSLREAVERSVDDAESGMDIDDLRDSVLTLVAAAGARQGEYPWLSALALRDEAGDHRRADELALPDAPLLDLLDDDTPVGVLHPDTVTTWPRHVLTAVGVLDTFAVVVDEAPSAPDHDLPDERDWWDSLAEPPHRMTAVRDLDLVAEHAWPAALRLLAGDPDTWRAMHEPGGHTGWWLANHAVLDDHAPHELRLPDAGALAGLYDPVPPVDVDPSVLRAIGVREELDLTGPDDAEDLLDRLADQNRQVTTGTAMRAHAAIAEAVQDGVLSAEDVRPPVAVRPLTGGVLPASEAMVLDAPWVLGVASGERVVSAGPDFALAEPLADVLDVPLATEVVVGVIREQAQPVLWADLGAVVDACDLAGLEVPAGGPLVHERLTVRIGLADHEVAWWVDRDVVHCTDSTEGMARALAWSTDRWEERHTFAALLEDPESLLG